jgi:hypothetical protein
VESATPTENAAGFERLPEVEIIRRWRAEQLRQAGYGGAALPLLADDFDVDLHTAVDLLGRGCPEGTALRILL